MRYVKDLHPKGFYLKEVAAERREQQYRPQNEMQQTAFDAFTQVVEDQMGPACGEGASSTRGWGNWLAPCATPGRTEEGRGQRGTGKRKREDG